MVESCPMVEWSINRTTVGLVPFMYQMTFHSQTEWPFTYWFMASHSSGDQMSNIWIPTVVVFSEGSNIQISPVQKQNGKLIKN